MLLRIISVLLEFGLILLGVWLLHGLGLKECQLRTFVWWQVGLLRTFLPDFYNLKIPSFAQHVLPVL